MPRDIKSRNHTKIGKRAMHEAIINARETRELYNKLHRRKCGHTLSRIINGSLDIYSEQADDAIMRVSKRIRRQTKKLLLVLFSSVAD